MTGLPLDRDPPAIRSMFARVAPAYDRLNHLLSLSLDRLWRRRAARRLGPDDSPALDLCCGTGDQAVALGRRGLRVVAADFCYPMLALAKPKLSESDLPRPATPITGDALGLPFPERSFGAVTISFGVRNIVDLDAALVETLRVLRPGGTLLVLEFSLPRMAPLRVAYLAYFRHVLPRVGAWVSGDGSAYSYLPESVLEFPQRDGFTARMERAGYVDTRWEELSLGTVCLYSARRER